MPRIRSVHPGIATDEDMLECSMPARLFFILLGTEADDYGCFAWKPVRLKMRIFPADNIEVEPLLAELAAVNRIVHYTVDGKHFGAIRNFTLFQRPKKPTSAHPRANCKMFPSGQDVSINDYIGLGKKGSELNGVQGWGSSELGRDKAAVSRELKPSQHGGISEKVGTRPAEGRKEGDNKKEIPITTNYQTLPPRPERADQPEPGGGFFEGEGGAEPEALEPDDEPGLGSEPIPTKPPTEAWARLGAELLELAGLDDRPKPIGTGIVRQWLADWSEDDIRAAVSDAVERESYDAAAIGNLKYFEPAIRRRVETRQADQRGAAAKFWADMPHAASVQFVGKWRGGQFEWEADKHGPAPDQPGFMGPADLKGPRQCAEPPPAPKPVTTAATWDVIGLRILTIAGLEDTRFPVPIGPVKDWMDRGWTEADIMGAVRAEVAKPGYTKPRSLKDFEVPIAEFVANRLAEQGVAA